MLNEWNFGLKQRFNIKCVIDVVTFVFACVLFLFFAKINGVSPYETFIFLTVIIALNATVHLITKQWILKAIKKSLTVQSDSLAETTGEIMDTINSQKRIYETLSANTKNISSLIEKLKSLSEDSAAVEASGWLLPVLSLHPQYLEDTDRHADSRSGHRRGDIDCGEW